MALILAEINMEKTQDGGEKTALTVHVVLNTAH